MPFGTDHVVELSEVVAQGCEIEQAQNYLEEREAGQGVRLGQIPKAQVAILGTVVPLGRRWRAFGSRVKA